MKGSPYIVIPVFNAFEEARECIASVLCHSGEKITVVVIDDCSPKGDFREFLSSSIDDARLEFFRNDENMGFVGTCNRGMALYPDLDVLLLNSDTVVTDGWLEKLQRAAYSAEAVGTVTPFTNNGAICSIPRMSEDNEIPAGLSLAEWAAVIESSASGDYQELPSCIGFCVYLKRKMLEKVGLFDEDAFGKGYGEENDLSLRAQAAGFKDILDHHTFILHKGNCSFLGLREELSGKNLETLNKRYPHYLDRVSKFCYRNPLRSIQNRIQDSLLIRQGREQQRVLHILHNGPFISRGDPLGGTEKHVSDLIETIDSVSQWSLVAAKGYYYLTAHLQGSDREFVLPASEGVLSELVSPRLFSIVHLHHTRWFDFSELCTALLAHGNFFVSHHDFNLVCPRFHLVTPAGSLCSGFECQSACGYATGQIAALRDGTRRLLTAAKRVIVFSDSTRRLLETILDTELPAEILPHGVPSIEIQDTQGQSSDGVFRIAIVGTLSKHKGSALFKQLVQLQSLNETQIEWHIFGKADFTAPPHVIDHGPYKREVLPALVRSAGIDSALFLSLCAETYSLVVDEVAQAGIALIVGPHGAPAERVQKYGAGWVLPSLELDAVTATIASIISDPAAVAEAQQRVQNLPIISVEQEAVSYEKYYHEAESSSLASIEDMLSRLNVKAITGPPPDPMLWKYLGLFANVLIHFLDSLGVRSAIQRQATALLPAGMLNRIKRAR